MWPEPNVKGIGEANFQAFPKISSTIHFSKTSPGLEIYIFQIPWLLHANAVYIIIFK